jgi:hypothetical protein
LFKGSMSLVKDEWCYVQNESSMCSIWDKEHEIKSSFWWED